MIRAIFPPPAPQPAQRTARRPYDYSEGYVSHVTEALARKLVRLAARVSRGAVDANVVEEARRIWWDIRDRQSERQRQKQAARMRSRRAERRAA